MSPKGTSAGACNFEMLLYEIRGGTCNCEGISPLGYWQKVNQSPTQTKPYSTLPPFEPRDSWSSYGAVLLRSSFIISGDPGRVIHQILDMRKYAFI